MALVLGIGWSSRNRSLEKGPTVDPKLYHHREFLLLRSIQPRFPELVNHCVVTSERCGQWGKLAAPGHLCTSNCRIGHFDDSAEVCAVFLRRSAEHPGVQCRDTGTVKER